MSWHMSERVMTGVVIGLVLSIIGSFGNTWYITKTLNTNPPLTDRVLALEIKMSEFGKTLENVSKHMALTSEKTHMLVLKIHNEQARRKPLVDFVEDEMRRGIK